MLNFCGENNFIKKRCKKFKVATDLLKPVFFFVENTFSVNFD